MITIPSAENVRAVTFDAGGTLIDPFPSVGHVYAEVAAAHGYPCPPPATLNRQFALAWKRKQNFDYSKPAWSALVCQTFNPGQPPAELPFFRALYDRFTDPAVWRIHPDAASTLQSLTARGLPLGIISNWDERLKPLLSALGIAHAFHAITISIDAGAEKPAAEIFRIAARELRLSPHQILHVGDGWTEDFLGARQAGFQALFLDRTEPGARTPHQIFDLRAIPARLDPPANGRQ